MSAGPRRVAWAAAALAVLPVLRFVDPGYHIDDAWISFRIARNWAAQGIPSFNLDSAPVEGMTNLSWTALAALALRVWPDLDPLLAARAVGVLLYMGTVALAATLAGRVAGERPTVAAAVAAGLVLVSGNVAFHAMSGLETPLWVLLQVLAAVLVGARVRGAGVLLGAVAGALACTRPEGFLIGPLYLAARAWVSGRRPWAGAALFAVAAVAVEAWRLHTYGAWVPNTALAKAPSVTVGVYYLLRWAGLALGVTGALALWPAGGRWARALAGVTIVSVLATTLTGGDWMIGYRRFIADQVLLAVLVGARVAAAPRRAWFLPVGWTAAAVWAAVGSTDAARIPADIVTPLAEAIGRSPEVRRVAAVDIGELGWVWPGPILDLAGLVDAHIARLAGGVYDKQWDEDYFRAQSPEIVLVVGTPEGPGRIAPRSPVEGSVLGSMHAHGGYAPVWCAPIPRGDVLLVFRRADVRLPSQAWSGVPADGACAAWVPAR